MVTKVNLNFVGEPSGVGGFVLCPRLLHEFAGPPILLKIQEFYSFDHRCIQNHVFTIYSPISNDIYTTPLPKIAFCIVSLL